MKRYANRRSIIVFLIAVAVQAFGFPLISKIFGLGDRLQAPSWIVIVLVSMLLVFIDQTVVKKKAP